MIFHNMFKNTLCFEWFCGSGASKNVSKNDTSKCLLWYGFCEGKWTYRDLGGGHAGSPPLARRFWAPGPPASNGRENPSPAHPGRADLVRAGGSESSLAHHWLLSKRSSEGYGHACIYSCMDVCLFACMYVCTYVRTYACMCVCVYVCMCVCVHVYVCMCICVYVRMCLCVSISVYFFLCFVRVCLF